MRKTILLAVVLLGISVSAAVAQPSGAVAVVMTRGTGYSGQIWSAVGDGPGNAIRRHQSNGFHVTTVVGTAASWIVVSSQGAPYGDQQADGARSRVGDLPLQARAGNGMFVTGLAYFDDVWLAISTEGTAYKAQSVLAGKRFPLAEVNGARQNGYAVTTMSYSDSGWVVVLSQGTTYTDQVILTGKSFPREEVDRRMRDGFAITVLGFGLDEWVVAMAKGTGYGSQVYLVDSLWSDETTRFIDRHWMASYHMTALVNNTLWPSFGTGNNGLIADRLMEQATSETAGWYDAFIKASAPMEDAFVAVQRLAGLYVQNRQWKAAADIYRNYRPLFPTMVRRFDRTIAILEAGEDTLQVEPLGGGVNTTGGEYVPVPTADGSGLYFTGRLRSDGVGEEDIYYATREKNDWGKAVGPRELNTPVSEAATSVSADGNRLTVYANRRDGTGGGDMYYSERTSTGWGELRKYPSPINTKYWDCDGFITSDGKAMLFTSDRPGGIGQYHGKDRYFHGELWGNLDIYVSVKTPTGWSAPMNLGPTINTPYADRTPFLHPDGKTLYFSSSGREGLGTLDVFKSTRLREDSWTEWSEPVNLGKQFNTVGSDWGYKVTTDGTIAYYAAGTRIGQSTTEDIYSITLPKSARPNPVATIRGKVTDPKGKPLTADVKWDDLVGGKNVGELKTNPRDGTYFITLPLGKNYGYFAEKEGYYPVSNNVDLRKAKESVNLTVDIVLVPIEEVATKGVAVRINNVFFDVDQSDLKPESRVELDRLADLIKQYPKAKVEIAGHTDNQSSDSYNIQLSQRRAQAVVDYLVSAGIARSALVSKGYGETKPVAPNTTEDGRAMNRRVEFRFLKQ